MKTQQIQIEQIDIDDLRPDPANPRRISDQELEALTRSIREFGFVDPVIARTEDKIVIGGHQRLVAARRLGYKVIPVVFVDLSKEQAHLLNIALNKISGSFDDELLARLLSELSATPDVDLTLTGYGEDELEKLLKSLDARDKREKLEKFDLDTALKDVQSAPVAKPGDIWILGDHRLGCGDSTNPDDVAKLMNGQKPPFWQLTRRIWSITPAATIPPAKVTKAVPPETNIGMSMSTRKHQSNSIDSLWHSDCNI